MTNEKLTKGKCEITTRHPNGKMVVLEGNIVELKENFCEVEIPKYNGEIGETVIRSIPNWCLTNTEVS